MSDGTHRTKLCALITALQQEPMSAEQLEAASGMHENAVRHWLHAFYEAKLIRPAGFAPKKHATGVPPSLWSWRFA